jgi:hypothetical protein
MSWIASKCPNSKDARSRSTTCGTVVGNVRRQRTRSGRAPTQQASEATTQTAVIEMMAVVLAVATV